MPKENHPNRKITENISGKDWREREREREKQKAREEEMEKCSVLYNGVHVATRKIEEKWIV